MPIASVNRRNKRKKKNALAIATSVIDRSGIVELLHEAATPASPRGRKPSLPQYELRAVLITMFYLIYRGMHISWANVVHALWFDLSPKQLRDIGLPSNWRCKNRRRQLRAARPGHVTRDDDTGTGDDDQAADTADTPAPKTGNTRNPKPAPPRSPWDNEYLRLWKFINKALAPIDDTVQSANKKQTANAITDGRQGPAGEAARALRLRCINALIRASLEHANAEYRPDVPADMLHAGILRHHKGDLAVDEHLFAVGLGKNTVDELNNIKQLAALSAHIRREEVGHAIGITAATTAYRPDGILGPTIAIGADIHQGVTGASQGAINAIDAIEEQGMRPPLASTARQLVIGDKAYPYYVGFTAWLLDHSYTLHAKLPETMNKVYDLAPLDNTLTTGPYLTRGCVLCPGVGATFLHANREVTVPDERTLTADKLRNHEPIEDQLAAALMPTNGRPTPVKAPTRGRPRADAPPAPDERRLTVLCPADMANPKVRCPIVPDSMNEDLNLPVIQNPPAPNARPQVCRKGTQSVTFNTEQIKGYSGHKDGLDGTWAHQDIYSPNRSRNESYFNRLMRPDTGNLRLGAIDFDKNGPVALAIAMTIAVTNLQVIDKHQEKHGNNPPRANGSRRRRHRARILNGQLKTKRRNRNGRN